MVSCFAVMLSIAGLAWVVFAEESATHDRCLRSALTHQGRLQCEEEYRDVLEEKYGVQLP